MCVNCLDLVSCCNVWALKLRLKKTLTIKKTLASIISKDSHDLDKENY